jgi:integrase
VELSGVGSTKGKRVLRVEVGPRVVRVLRDLRAAQAEHRTADDADALIFPGQHGGHLDRSTISRDWHPAALKRAGLRRPSGSTTSATPPPPHGSRADFR